MLRPPAQPAAVQLWLPRGAPRLPKHPLEQVGVQAVQCSAQGGVGGRVCGRTAGVSSRHRRLWVPLFHLVAGFLSAWLRFVVWLPSWFAPPAPSPTPTHTHPPRRRRPACRLPLLRGIAPEFYAHLTSYPSWTGVIWRFITDPTVGAAGVMTKRVERSGGSKGALPASGPPAAALFRPSAMMPLLKGITASANN